MSNQDLDWLAAQQPQRMNLDPRARERALLALVQHTGLRGPDGFILRAFRLRALRFAIATGAAALAAALVLSVTSSGGGATENGRLSQRGQGGRAAVHHSVIAQAPLMRLADYVSASVAPAGDATLVARTTSGAGHSVTVYDLYADNGSYFFSPTASGLLQQISAHHKLAGGLFAREIAAAKVAASGNVRTGAQDMADAPDPSHVISPTQAAADRAAVAAKQRALGQPQQPEGSLFDNWAWGNSQDALIAGSGEPDVRAGVLRILATLPGVTVTHGTSAGQPTLVLTAGAPEFGAGYREQLTINADTGVPIEFIGGPPGATPAATVDYKVSRVTLARLQPGN